MARTKARPRAKTSTNRSALKRAPSSVPFPTRGSKIPTPDAIETLLIHNPKLRKTMLGYPQLRERILRMVPANGADLSQVIGPGAARQGRGNAIRDPAALGPGHHSEEAVIAHETRWLEAWRDRWVRLTSNSLLSVEEIVDSLIERRKKQGYLFTRREAEFVVKFFNIQAEKLRDAYDLTTHPPI